MAIKAMVVILNNTCIDAGVLVKTPCSANRVCEWISECSFVYQF